jgi:phospholipid/cholesterol/gamma-HCH transport system ATP-binding protein
MIDKLIQQITREYEITTVVVTHDMNSVMEIGEYVMFLHQGSKIWEGSSDNISHAEAKELQDFIFANKLMRTIQAK